VKFGVICTDSELIRMAVFGITESEPPGSIAHADISMCFFLQWDLK